LLGNLICNLNKLSHLNVSSNTYLTSLTCGNNSLNSLDISNLNKLVKIDCSNNNLESLDFSHLSELKVLNCSDNKLTSLSLKNEENLQIYNRLFSVENNPNLTCIEVDDVNYSTQNWTNIDAIASFSENCNALSVEGFDKDSYKIYPNPFSDKIQIYSEEILDNIIISTLQGKVILKTTAKEIDLSSLSTGIYLIKLVSGTKVVTEKIIKE
jgi:Leucine-rich repeat (LRR) protein